MYQYGPNPISWIDPWGWASRRADFRAAKRAAGIPNSSQYSTHAFVRDKNFENRTVYKFKVNNEDKFVVLHENDKFGRGPHFHAADGMKNDPMKPGKYNQYPGHFPEDEKGFTRKKGGKCS